ncbi:complement component C7 [Melanotaenia boesemani]|uniref:complement component C7 n=1 Tax=Melanotaenia boesemani TaxID=1250792 RepID=UPI001C051E51|nr:complement component C7 [Melanotaenia boesemani]
MKNIALILPWLIILFTARVLCDLRVHCQWGPYDSWSQCNPCTKTQTRSRAMVQYSQFGGNPCDGLRTETRPCQTTQSCPLDHGCANRFRCQSGKCINKSLKCNGDQDCEGDGLDERDCPTGKFIICEYTIPPPNIQQIGLGYDAVTEKRRGSVINTNSFGGQCRPTYSGDHKVTYRLPLNVIQYSFVVKVQTDFSDETFTSKWHYAKDIVERETAQGTTSGFRNYDFHEKLDKTQTYKLLVLKNDVEVAQFQSNSPNYLPISEEFWKALEKLPTVYDYSEYRKILERFGTHYVAEGSLGGSFKVIISIDEETEKYMLEEKLVLRECERTKRWILFIPFTVEKCKEKDGGGGSTKDFERSNNVDKVFVDGGSVSHIEALKRMDLKDPKKNWDMYSNWAESVRSFPQIINQKLRLLSELVKEVKCAGMKRVYLRRAIEQYLTESHPCHCRPCRNNGLVVMDGDVCKCICKHGTKGLACEEGTEAEGQQGVIHGSWSCWSAWSLCTRTGNRLTHSRTRSCSNPFPQNGGQHCIGEPIETSECDDDELQYLKTMEPECFDDTLQPSPKCDTPLPLINGYIQNPKDVYLVGNRVEYSCTAGFHLVGQSILECTSGKTWSGTPGQCARSMCRLNSLTEGVIASPLQPFYSIGQSVVLSCPKGRILEGEATIICNPSLNFSPDPREIRCIEDENPEPTHPTVECKRWEKPYKGKCICISAKECGPSLELCATPPGSSSFLAITVCKMHVLQCMEKHIEIADYNSCRWGQRTTPAPDCTGCKMWETCDDQANVCRCKDSAECSIPGIQVCVRIGEDASAATQTMSECEAGLRRCKGEKVSVVSIHPCAS